MLDYYKADNAQEITREIQDEFNKAIISLENLRDCIEYFKEYGELNETEEKILDNTYEAINTLFDFR